MNDLKGLVDQLEDAADLYFIRRNASSMDILQLALLARQTFELSRIADALEKTAPSGYGGPR